MLVLGIDSSTEIAAVGLVDDKNVIAEINVALYRRHSEKLLPNIKYILEQLNYKIEDIDLLAVGAGPGSYTGLRIALSTVKAFSLAHDIPLVALSSLDILVWNIRHNKNWLVPVIDARNERVYTALFKKMDKTSLQNRSKYWNDRKKWQDSVFTLENLLKKLKKIDNNDEFVFVGNAVNYYGETFVKSSLEAIISTNEQNIPRGSAVAGLGLYVYKKRGGDEPDSLVPRYLKKPQAEINFQKIGSE